MNKTSLLLSISLGLVLVGCGQSVPGAYPYNYTIMTDAVSPLSTPPLTPTPELATSTMTALPVEEPSPTEAQGESLKITIVYNNVPNDPRLTTSLGFGAYIEYDDSVVLFDAGTSGEILLENMRILDLDPAKVQSVVISHAHDDHYGGLADFLRVSSHPPVFLISSFDDDFIEATRELTDVFESTSGQEIAPGILTTGEIPSDIPEQALIIRTSKGLVVITGCAHPGIVRIVERAIELTGEPVYLVMGGFHMWEMDAGQIESIIADLRRLGVQVVAPSHCTGDLATQMFADEYGENFIPNGVGSVINIDN